MRSPVSFRRLVPIAAAGLAVGIAACTPLKPVPPAASPAELTIDPTQASFEDEETKVFTVTNTGDEGSGPIDVSFGAGAGVTISADPCFEAGGVTVSASECPFTVTAETCFGAVLDGGEVCTVAVQFEEGEPDLNQTEGQLLVSAIPGGEVTAALSELV